MATPSPHTRIEKEQAARFVTCLRHALVSGELSQRQLAERMGITIGSFAKYLRGEVPPLRVATHIQAALARELGVTLDALVSFYMHGEYATAVTVEAVESWIRSESGQADLPRLMESLSDAGQRWLAGVKAPVALLESAAVEPEVEPEPEPYTWPIEEIRDAQLSDKFRERLGLTDEVLKRLATTGEFDEDLVEAFSIACNYELDAVRDAFEKRQPITL